MRKLLKSCAPFLILALVVVLTAGCPPQSPPAKVTVLLSAGDDTAKADVPIADMAQFLITITEISLTGPVEEGAEGEGEGEGGAKQGNQQVVFEGAVEVNLLDLTDVSVLLSEAEIPAGRYTKLTLDVQDPEITLVDTDEDPNNDVIPAENIQLTANGRLFVSQQIEVPEGNSNIVVTLDSLKLVERGNGEYNLTPQLQVTVDFEPAPVVVAGTVQSLNTDLNTLTILLDDGTTTVDVTYEDTTPIFAPTDPIEGPATGTEILLIPGVAHVEVTGVQTEEGPIAATQIVITV